MKTRSRSILLIIIPFLALVVSVLCTITTEDARHNSVMKIQHGIPSYAVIHPTPTQCCSDSHTPCSCEFKFKRENVLIVFIFFSIPIFFSGYLLGKSKQKPNQQVDPIVKTPADEVEAQGTQGHP